MTASVQLKFRLTSSKDSEVRDAEVANLVIAGWTGRDKAATEAHIKELEAIGVPRPKQTPCFYRASAHRLTTANAIQVLGEHSSGEVEFFLLALADGIWVGVGSDHTDRKVETYDVSVSKQMCAKPVSAELWRLDDVAGHWDQLQLRSTITIQGKTETYQDGTVATMLPTQELMKMYQPDTGILKPGTLMFCGTLAVQGGVRMAEAFKGELHDPVLDRTLACEYKIITLPLVE